MHCSAFITDGHTLLCCLHYLQYTTACPVAAALGTKNRKVEADLPVPPEHVRLSVAALEALVGQLAKMPSSFGRMSLMQEVWTALFGTVLSGAGRRLRPESAELVLWVLAGSC